MNKIKIFEILAGALSIIFVILLASAASGEEQTLGTFKVNQCIELKQICANCSYVNITSVNLQSVNSTQVLGTVQMTKIGTEYNYTFCNSSITGAYIINWVADPNGQLKIGNFNLFVTKTGNQLETSQSLIYILMAVFVFFLFILSLYFAILTPYKNTIGEDGLAIKITKAKYVKLGFIALSYAMLTWFLNTLIALSDNFLDLSVFYGFVSLLFNILISISLYFGIFILIVAFFEIIRDANLRKNLADLGRSLS